MFNKLLPLADKSIYTCPADDPPDACDSSAGVYAYVYPADPTQTVYICEFAFTTAETNYMEGVQTIIHELSHFDSIGGTTDDGASLEECNMHLMCDNPVLSVWRGSVLSEGAK